MGALSTDDLIAALRKAPPAEWGAILAANRGGVDMQFFLRLAEMSDAAADEKEKKAIADFASAITRAVENLLERTDSKLQIDAQTAQELLKLAADEKGEFEVPIPATRVDALRAEMRKELSSLGEGFVVTIKAYMKQANDDGLEGMVAVLRQLLQVFASEKLLALVEGRKLDPSLGAALRAVLLASPAQWEAVMQEQLKGGGGGVCIDPPSCEAFLNMLQLQMSEVVLTMPQGTLQQVLAEFLNQLLVSSRSVAERVETEKKPAASDASPRAACDERRRHRLLRQDAGSQLAPRSEQAWWDEWGKRIECWWIATPHRAGLQACFGALSLVLTSHFEQFVRHRGNHGVQPQVEHDCEWLEEGRALQLPDFPALGDSFDFVMPPVPRLLPSWQHLQSLLPSEQQQELVVQQAMGSEEVGWTPVVMGLAAAPVGAALALGLLALQQCRWRTQLRRWPASKFTSNTQLVDHQSI